MLHRIFKDNDDGYAMINDKNKRSTLNTWQAGSMTMIAF
jgi:hypothetical protein